MSPSQQVVFESTNAASLADSLNITYDTAATMRDALGNVIPSFDDFLCCGLSVRRPEESRTPGAPGIEIDVAEEAEDSPAPATRNNSTKR